MATAPNNIFPALSNNFISSQKALNCGFFEITPIAAAQIIEHRNTGNRKVAHSKLEQTCSDIREGRFLVNGESIVFSSCGKLLDGQHRLTGCIRTGIPIISLVAFGIDEDARRTIDTGKLRTAGDIAQLSGVADGNNVTAIARMMIAYRRGNGVNLTRPHDISVGEIIDFIEANPNIHEMNRWSAHYQKGLISIMGRTVLSAARMICEPALGPGIIEYLGQVGSGESIKSGDPAFSVRRRLFGAKTTRAVCLEAVLRGAIAYHEGRTLTRIEIHNRFPAIP